ncbi:MAG: hypothetical protein H6844_13330 [Alphaproteobacteria bacterium]|nr:hypothetical protein [Alphaproteobacteria bacterium]
MQGTPNRHCEAKPKQSERPASAGLLRRLRLLAMTSAGLSAAGPALAHPGHGAPVFHTHAWEIGLAVVAAIVLVGIGLRALGKRK